MAQALLDCGATRTPRASMAPPVLQVDPCVVHVVCVSLSDLLYPRRPRYGTGGAMCVACCWSAAPTAALWPPWDRPRYTTAFVFDGVSLGRQLIDAGADIAARSTRDGLQPLHTACAAGNLHMCQLLLQSGADAFARDELGRTPLKIATHAHVQIQTMMQRFVRGEGDVYRVDFGEAGRS